MSRDEQLMMHYLLDELPEDERVRLEQRFFADDEFYEQLQAVENELMYEYAQGRLSPRQREVFQKKFLAAAEDRQRANVAQAIIERVSGPESKPTEKTSPRWLQSFAALLQLHRPVVQFSLAAITLIAVIAGGLFYSELMVQQRRSSQIAAGEAAERQKRIDLEQELAKLRQAPPIVASLILQPGLVRGGQEQNRLRIPAIPAGMVQIQLDLRRPASYESYRATLKDPDGNQLWSEDMLRATAPGNAVIIKLPAASVPTGDYEVTLFGVSANRALEEVATYYFAATKN